MHDCGGLMMAVKWEMSNMPRFEIVNVPPYRDVFSQAEHNLMQINGIPDTRGEIACHREPSSQGPSLPRIWWINLLNQRL
jgi:hypothetical protein